MGKKIQTIRVWLLVLLMIFNYYMSWSQNDDRVPITPTLTQYELDSLKTRFLSAGDSNAYVDYCFFSHVENKFLYALYMANKFNSEIAQLDVYSILYSFYEEHGIEMDSLTNAFAMSYLKRSADQNCSSAMFALSRHLLYGEGIPQDTVAAKEYIYKIFDKPKADKVWFIEKRQYEESLSKLKK